MRPLFAFRQKGRGVGRVGKVEKVIGQWSGGDTNQCGGPRMAIGWKKEPTKLWHHLQFSVSTVELAMITPNA